MSDPERDRDFPSGEQNEERDELLAELEALLAQTGASITSEQRQTFKLYVAEHEGEIEWLREQCRKLKDGSLSAAEAQQWFDAFVAMESDEPE